MSAKHGKEKLPAAPADGVYATTPHQGLAGGGTPPISILTEQVVTFDELARRLPCRRGGRPTHVETIRRWRVRGLKGVKLAAFRCGGTWATTLEAYERFCEALTRLPD